MSLVNADLGDIEKLVAAARYEEASSGYQHLLTVDPANQTARLDYARLLWRMNQPQEAVGCLNEVAGSAADRALAGAIRGEIYLEMGRRAEAESSYRQAVQVDPSCAEAWCGLGTLLGELGKSTEATRSLEEALRLRPDYPEALNNLGMLLLSLGKPAEAADRFRAATLVRFDDANGHFNLGNALTELGRPDEAESAYRQALLWKPVFPEAQVNLADLLMQGGRDLEAAQILNEARWLSPDFFEIWANLAVVSHPLGQHAEAAEAWQQAIRIRPDYLDGHVGLGDALARLGRLPEAFEAYRGALQRAPGHVPALMGLAGVAQAAGQRREAIQYLEQAAAANPKDSAVHARLARLRHDAGRLGGSVQAYEQAVALTPQDMRQRRGLAAVMLDQGRTDEAIAVLKRVLRQAPDDRIAEGQLLLALNYSSAVTPATVHEAHRRWGEQRYPVAAEALAPRPRAPGERLRIGYVSPDLRAHSVGFFIEPVLEHHDRERFEVYCYSELPVPLQDAATLRLKGHAQHWLDTHGMTDEALAGRVRADGIDLLIDLAGHTMGNRLGVFALHPAPVQASYLGYVCTTGLPAMDFRISDETADPAGETEELYTERLTRVPGHYCYRPEPGLPEPGPLPAAANGYVTFISTNALPKLSDAVLAVWGQVMQGLPTARLIVKARGLEDGPTAGYQRARLAHFGVPEDRLALEGWSPALDYIETLRSADIALDAFPFNGGTTSYHSLWMGLPVVTTAGACYVSRMGAAILTGLGQTDLIAASRQEVVAVCRRLAGDLEALAARRAGLRERMQSSPLLDGAGYTRRLEEAYLAIAAPSGP